ncbi:peptidase inhibitor family I36 protein [Kribbella sp. NPDC056951]|uniref:peptidase inhibitor family I36 protein n=1 Tax=Kribbella sp. NPDC056951 TaxID=3345978 RepID=UPI003639237B
MNTFRKSLIAVLGAVATVLVLSAPANAAPIEEKATNAEMAQFAEQTGRVWDAQKQELLAAYDCPSGEICFYTGRDGTGDRCKWPSYDVEWLASPGVCSWADTIAPKSVRNNGTNTSFTGVRYYSRPNFDNTAGCTRRGTRGTFVTPEKLRSHQWVTGACG